MALGEIIKIVITVFVGGLSGAVVAYFTARLRFREIEKSFELKIKEIESQIDISQKAERKKEESRLRVKYSNPLRVSAEDFGKRLSRISRKIEKQQEKDELKNWFSHIRDARRNKQEFTIWCNDIGHFAMTTLYLTAVYLAYATKIRIELPFREVNPDYQKGLIERIEKVRNFLGGFYGIWQETQDAVGESVLRNGEGVIGYREFCSRIMNDSEYPWLSRLVEYYRYIDSKGKDIANVIDSLQDLYKFLD
jgi:phage regulator Rha-like protein